MQIDEKLKALREKLKEMEKILIAFSGGVDSTFLLKVCIDVLGRENVVAITADSPLYVELEEAKKIAEELGVKHLIIKTDELRNEEFVKNNPQRCYYCKMELFSKLKKIAKEMGIKHVIEASVIDDLNDYRPGRKAIKELGIKSPLLEVGFTKEEIRMLSKKWGLPTWNKASQSCLASRFPYGHEINEKEVEMIRKAEKFLKNSGFRIVRVRHHGKLARIEVGIDEIDRFFDKELREKIVEKLKEIGYTWVCLDLIGYRAGSMNEAL